MPPCECYPVRWKNRRAYRLSNEVVELTVLLGGGHLADFRLKDSAVNVLWEAPWETIEPQTFTEADAPLYGADGVGRFLSGYTGHGLVLGYFGMPSDSQAAQGLPLHGEAASAEWNVCYVREGETSAVLTVEVELPATMLHCRREITLRSGASAAFVQETVANRSSEETAFQWVQHAAFGEPLFTRGEASLFVPAKRAITWPLGYEGHELLPDNVEFEWSAAPTISGGTVDLSQPFPRDGTGFVHSLLVSPEASRGYAAVHNRRLNLVAGYCFDRERFPWIALWEENCARDYPPWNGATRVRGVEFGTSPMPLGLDHAREMRTLFGTPVIAKLPPRSDVSTGYELFLAEVPSSLESITHVSALDSAIVIYGDERVQITSSRRT